LKKKDGRKGDVERQKTKGKGYSGGEKKKRGEKKTQDKKKEKNVSRAPNKG